MYSSFLNFVHYILITKINKNKFLSIINFQKSSLSVITSFKYIHTEVIVLDLKKVSLIFKNKFMF